MERFLKVVKFDEEKGFCLLSLFVGDSVKWLRGFEDKLAIVLRRGFF